MVSSNANIQEEQVSSSSSRNKNIPTSSLIARSKDIVGEGNYTFGCAISPDGLCVLTCTSADNVLRLYNTSDASRNYSDDLNNDTSKPNVLWEASLVAKEGDSIRGYAWYPRMNSYEPSTCIFLTTSREQPMHLIDAYSGAIRCSYLAYDNVDAIESAQCVSFTNDGQRIFAGFNRCIKIFHTSNPGRDCDVLHMGKTRRSRDGQKGIVSSIAFPAAAAQSNNVFAVGTYAGSIYLYDDRAPSGDPSGVVLSNSGLCIAGQGKKRRRYNVTDKNNDDYNENIFEAAKAKWFQQIGRRGITQLKFLPSDDKILFSASRRSNAVVCWDIRMLGTNDRGKRTHAGLASFERDGDTNQKLQFDIDDETNRLFVGSQDKCVKIYDTSSRALLTTISGLSDSANGVSYFNKMLAVSLGARKFNNLQEEDDESISFSDYPPASSTGSLELYQID